MAVEPATHLLGLPLALGRQFALEVGKPGFGRLFAEYRPERLAETSLNVPELEALRLDNPGTYQLPATRVEVMYAPETYAERPNAPLTIEAP